MYIFISYILVHYTSIVHDFQICPNFYLSISLFRLSFNSTLRSPICISTLLSKRAFSLLLRLPAGIYRKPSKKERAMKQKKNTNK